MATAAFKSTSKRPTSTTTTTRHNSTTQQQQQQQQQQQPRKQQDPTHKVIPRRSQSVSAFSRTQLDITSYFNNTRDNPLFWVDGSQPLSINFDDEIVGFPNLNGVSDDGERRRGRSVSRNCDGGGGGDGGERKFPTGGGGGGRSLSRVDTGRRQQRHRSMSRGPHCGNYESEREQESGLLSNLRSKSNIGLNRTHTALSGSMKRSASDLSEVLKTSNTWSSQHPAIESSDDSAISLFDSRSVHWNDGTPTSAIIEVEEKTIRPVLEERMVAQREANNAGGILETVCSEVRQAISDMHKDFKDAMRSSGHSNVITGGHFYDCTPELGSPSTVELVSDFRDEFARELEECEERTRKLRAELAVEEHRELELNKILYDIVPEPETPQVQKPHLIRKASTERKKMSKRLEDEAMAYFDECVSISTFDDSDFSSMEDPPSHMVTVNPGGEITNIRGISTSDSAACSLDSQDLMRQSPLKPCYEDSSLSAICSSNNFARRSSLNSLATKSEVSHTSKLSDSTSLSQDIRNYVKNLSKDREKESCESLVRTIAPKTESSSSVMPVEEFLLDKVTFRSRIESGCMLLCGGGTGFPGAPFSSSFW